VTHIFRFLRKPWVNYLHLVIYLFVLEEAKTTGVCGFTTWFLLTPLAILIERSGGGEGGLKRKMNYVRCHLIHCSQ
jgi:hypothetical protein